ncbi:hypothetical protein D9M70_626970 [compost metagenome]
MLHVSIEEIPENGSIVPAFGIRSFRETLRKMQPVERHAGGVGVFQQGTFIYRIQVIPTIRFFQRNFLQLPALRVPSDLQLPHHWPLRAVQPKLQPAVGRV